MSKIIEFVYPEHAGEELDPKRIEMVINYLVESADSGSRAPKSVEITKAILKKHFLNDESIANIAKEFNVSTAYLYQVRSKIKRMMRRPFIKKFIFDDEYFENNKNKLIVPSEPPETTVEEFVLLANSLSPRALGLLKHILAYNLSINMNRAKTIPDIMGRINKVPPDVFVTIWGYGEKSVNELMSHIGSSYMSVWWPELDYDPNINMHSLCIEWLAHHKYEIDERLKNERHKMRRI